MIVYLNGSYVDAATASLSLFDGGYLFGDGLFETLRLYRGRPHALDRHLARLNRQLELLGFTWHADESAIATIIADLVKRNGVRSLDCRARLTVSRGFDPGNPLPLSGLDSIEATVSIFITPVAADLEALQEEGVGVRVMKSAFARGNFPQLKSLNYLPTIMALRFAAEHGCPEALLVDRRGLVLEGATSNVFVLRGGRLLTPPIRLGLLPGLTRGLVLDAASALDIPAAEEAFDRRDLLGADEVFLTGTVKEVLPVVRIDNEPVGEGVPGRITRQIQKKYRQGILDTLAAQSDPE